MDLNKWQKEEGPPELESIRQYPVVVFEHSIFVKNSFKFESKRFRIHFHRVSWPLTFASVLVKEVS